MAHATTHLIETLSASLRRNAATLYSASRRAKRGEARGIHRLRVATRRLREALPAGAEIAALEDLDAESMSRSLRRVTKSLGPVRELDVARGVLADFAEREAWPTAVVARVDSYCKRLRDDLLGEAIDAIDRFDVKEMRADLEALRGRLADRSGRPSSLDARVGEGARALAREIDAAGTLYAPAALHEVRIATKKLRYVLELTGEPVRGALRRLRALQSALGKMHDAQVLQHRIQELAAMSGDRGFVATLTAMERSVEAACREAHAKLLKTLPVTKALAETMAGSDLPQALRPRNLGRPIKMATTKGTGADRRRRGRRIA